MIVRQDKIGYNNDEIVNMIQKGLISLCETINDCRRFDNCEIDLIYTLAWSRK